MKNILIPTDFTLDTFKVVDGILAKKIEANIIFTHGFKLADDISSLLMLGRRSRDLDNISDDFYKLLSVYRERHADLLKSMRIEYFYGNTTIVFRDFLEALSIDCIAYNPDMSFVPLNRYSIVPQVMVERAHCEILHLNADNLRKVPQIKAEEQSELINGIYTFV